MNPSNPLFSIIIYAIAFATAYIINLKFKFVNTSGRYENIDGLRGFLALGVFIHHANIWFKYINEGVWKEPNSNLYNQFGQTSVALFFMITSFLFVTKLLDSTNKPYNWNRFFISRIFRLAPMYYFSLFIIIAFVMITSNFKINVGIPEFIMSLFHWFVFTITTTKFINNNPLTVIINANVNWSLPFEWLFYFALPLISLLILKIKPPKFYLIISFGFVALFILVHGLELHHISSFIGGAIAPILIKYSSVKKNVNTVFYSSIIVICVALILFFKTSESIWCKLLIAIIFNIIALGNSMFGLLKSSILKFLGEICYSTYLLHGIILFTTFYFGFGMEASKQFSQIQYCLIIFSITPIVVLVSFLGYKFIEKPFMDLSKKIKI
ncbi:acyltransferase family protein [Flavobacterium sp.]|uniref:acyltransferase family protein n=1 Tax=Flavobacterium sp. TaxID=239 RepID=UPI0037516727